MKSGTRSIGSGGLSEMSVKDNGTGTGIVFATSPGNVALDGDGPHSPFTASLLTHIGTPNTSLQTIMSRVTGDVNEATDNQQRPWFHQSYTDEVFLYQTAALASAPAPTAIAPEPQIATDAASGLEDEKYMFNLARDTGHVEDYELYLEFYPNGRFARHARVMIERLKGAQTETQMASVNPAVTGTTRTLAGYNPNAPLLLEVTQQLRSTPSSQMTENALAMGREKRREVQARLNAAGHNVGGADGQFGGKTRTGIASWQMANGLPATQYLNGVQLDLLTSQTEATYMAHMTAPVATKTRTYSSGSKRSSTNAGVGAVGESIVKGVSEGIGRAFGEKIFGR